MADIATKSTGQLLDELVTNAFKTVHAAAEVRDASEFLTRHTLLSAAIDRRFEKTVADSVAVACSVLFLTPEQAWHERILGLPLTAALHAALLNLCEHSCATWIHQEHVMSGVSDALVAKAGRAAQQCNALRTEAMRRIDQLLGEAEITITTKTYG
jgi:hypothetical protein